MKLKNNFLKTAHYLWSAESGLWDATEIEAMLEAWLVTQKVRSKSAIERQYIDSILDNEKLSDFNEKCNHEGVRFSQVATYFDEVYEVEEEVEVEYYSRPFLNREEHE
jgi:hypothetical protein